MTTVTKENGKAIDERPHYVQVTESAKLSRGHFPNKPHLTEHVFLFPLGAHSPRANPNFFLLSGRLGEFWRSGERIWSEKGARGFDLLLAFALSHRDSAIAWTKRGPSVVEQHTTNSLLGWLWQKESCVEVASHNGTVWEEEVRKAQSAPWAPYCERLLCWS